MSESTSSASDKKAFYTKIDACFNSGVIKEVLRSNFSNPKTKITDDAVELMSELTKTLVIESALRAAKQSSSLKKPTVSIDHFEGALPQIMLDFP